jgi:hypothetical protein
LQEIFLFGKFRGKEKYKYKILNMSAEKIADRAIAKMNKKITNEIFLIIQNDRKLMHDYLRQVEQSGLDAVNQKIGKRVKDSYGLENDDREKNPSCTLIQSHQRLKEKKLR